MPDLPKPAHPWIDPVQRIMDLEAQVDTLSRQLAEIDAVTASCFPADTPLPSRIADLVADWHDTTEAISPWLSDVVAQSSTIDGLDALAARQAVRRGIA